MSKVFSLPSAFCKMLFHSTNTLYVRLPYQTTVGKVNEFVLGCFMLLLGVALSVSQFLVYPDGSWLFSVIRYTAALHYLTVVCH